MSISVSIVRRKNTELFLWFVFYYGYYLLEVYRFPALDVVYWDRLFDDDVECDIVTLITR